MGRLVQDADGEYLEPGGEAQTSLFRPPSPRGLNNWGLVDWDHWRAFC
jgi:hypothetical protein